MIYLFGFCIMVITSVLISIKSDIEDIKRYTIDHHKEY